MSFSGKGTTLFNGISIKQKTKTNFEVLWDGFEGKINHSLDLRNLQGEITVPELSLNNSDYQFHVNKIKIDFDTKESNNLAIGNNNINIDKIDYQENNDSLFKLKDFNINSSLNKEDPKSAKLQYLISININDSKILEQEFTKNTYKLSANSINPEFFNVLHSNYEQNLLC